MTWFALLTTALMMSDLIGDYRFEHSAPLANQVAGGLPDLQFDGFSHDHPPLLTGQAVPEGNGYALAWTKQVPQVGYDQWTPADLRIRDVELGDRFTIWMRVLYGGFARGDVGYQFVRFGDSLTWSTTKDEEMVVEVHDADGREHKGVTVSRTLLSRFSRWYDLALVYDRGRVTLYATAITLQGALSTNSETLAFGDGMRLAKTRQPLHLLHNTNSALEHLRIYRTAVDADTVRGLSKDARLPGPHVADLVEVGTTRQLFLDDALIESMEGNIQRKLHPVRKHRDNPVIARTQSQQIEGFGPTFWGSVLYDEQERLFKCWYIALTFQRPEICNHLYAVSEDGIRWRKAKLDLVGADNRFNPPGYSGGHAGMWLTVRRDDDEPDAQQRYKGFIQHNPLWHVTSPDGLHWSDSGIAAHYTDDTTTAVYHPVRDEYLKIGRFCPDGRSLALRLMMTCVGDSPLAEGNSLWHLVMLPTEDDLHRDPYQQFYHMPAFAYGDAYIGLLGMYHAGPEDGKSETELTFSRDGLNWHRVAPHQPFIPRGGDGDWDSGFGVLPGTGPIERGDELWFYYSHYSNGHHGPYRNAGIGLATLRRDGFVSLSSEQGSIVTRSFELVGDALKINAVGRVDVTLLDENGELLASCDPIEGDSCDHSVTIPGNLHGRSVKLRFDIAGDLYAFQVVRH